MLESHKAESAESALKNTICMLPHQALQVYIHTCMIKFYITPAWFHFSRQTLTEVEECVSVHVCAEGGSSGVGGRAGGG